MLVRINKSNQAWKSDDGKTTIWDFEGTLEDGSIIGGSTMSGKISSSIGQTLDLTTRVSKSNKTYYIQVQQENSQFANNNNSNYQVTQAAQQAQPQQTPQAAQQLVHAIGELTNVVRELTSAVHATRTTAPAKFDSPFDDRSVKDDMQQEIPF